MLRTWLGKKGFQAETAGSVTAAKRLLEKTAFDLILSDLRLPDDDGITLLPWKKEQGIDAPLIIMTSYADIQNAVLAMKEGASDYVSKPIKPDLLLQKINDALANGSTADNDVAEKPATDSADDSDPDFLEGESEAARKLYSMVSLVAPTQMSVLINGESGAGKEFFPQIIHAYSSRKHSKYIAVNCGAIPEGTIDSELFGHEKGAFTGAISSRKGYFEEANGGTIFLDEVAELPLTTQARLLRVLESGEFIKVGSSEVQKTNIRVVAATNVNMQKAVAEGRFREDLYYRLSTIFIVVPPLRDRGDDIILLSRKFSRDFADKYRMPAIEFEDSAKSALLSYRWPGNVRQLKNLIEQISLFDAGRKITADEVAAYLPYAGGEFTPAVAPGEMHYSYEKEREMLFKMIFEMRKEIDNLRDDIENLAQGQPRQNIGTIKNLQKNFAPQAMLPQHALPASQPNEAEFINAEPHDDATMTLEDTERETIKRSLERNEGKRKKTAEELKISERTLYRKIKEYGLE